MLRKGNNANNQVNIVAWFEWSNGEEKTNAKPFNQTGFFMKNSRESKLLSLIAPVARIVYERNFIIFCAVVA